MANLPNSGQIPMFTPPFPSAGGNQNIPTTGAGEFPPRPPMYGMGGMRAMGPPQPAPPGVYQPRNPGSFPTGAPQKGALQGSVNGLSTQSSLNTEGHLTTGSHQRLPGQAAGPPLGGPMPAPPFTGPAGVCPPNRFASNLNQQPGPLMNGPANNYNQMQPVSSQPNRMQAPPPISVSSSYPFPQTSSELGPPGPNSTPPYVSSQTSQNMSGQFPRPPLIGQTAVRPPLPSGSSSLGRGSPDGRPPTEFAQKHPGFGPPVAGSSTPPGPQTGRPGELPVPFHGQGQYSHQIGMQLTPGTGLTPNSSEPTSQRSSRTPSPANPVFDDMEGGITQNMMSTENRGGTPPFTPPKQRPNSQLPNQTPPQMMGGNMAGPPPMTGPQTRPPSALTSPPQMGKAPGMTGPPQAGIPPGMPGPPPTGPTFGMSGPPQTGPPLGMSGPPQSGTAQGVSSPPQIGMMGMTNPPQTMMAQGQLSGDAPTYRAPPPPQMNVRGMAPPSQFGQPSAVQPPPLGMTQMTGPSPRPQYPQMNTFAPTNSAPWAPQGNVPMSTAGQPIPTQPNVSQQFTTGYPQPPGPGQAVPPPQPNAMMPPSAAFGAMSLQQDGQRMVNLLQEKILIPNDGLETPKPKIHHDFKKVNCNPEVFRCTLNAIPQTSSLQNKARLPLGILIHPFKDLSQLPVIQSSVIVRCRSCRTYINPFVYFSDQRRWKCNLCYRVNELPDEFSFDPVSKTYGDPQRRPEIRSATIEFIAPSEYMLRPPQPAVYLFVIDVSFNAIETGYLNLLCHTMLEELDKVPGDGRTQIGFIAFDRALHFFNLAEGLSQPQMLVVSDIEDIFLPCPDNLLVNLQESKELVIDLLNQLPSLFEKNTETGSALGAAMQAAYKMTSGTGGRISVFQTTLPTVAPGALQSREEPGQNSGKNMLHLGPATDFYKKLSLDCSAQQVAVDLFLLNGQYADIASLSCVSKYSGGSILYYPSFHTVKNPSLADKFETDLRRYLTRKIGFESVMRIRCTKGLSIHTFHGNFFVRSTDLLSLPNVNPDAGFGMQMSIEDSLTDVSQVCFQAALLYTSSKGERRIRVHTLCVPTTNELSEVFAGADQQAIASLLAKMAADRCVSSSLTDAREALINAAVDALNSYSSTLHSSQRMGSLMLSHSLRMLPLYVLAMLKSVSFRLGSTKLDNRVSAMQQCKSLPVSQLIQTLYPSLYPVHDLDKCRCVTTKADLKIPQPRLLHLTAANIDRTGVYLMDAGDSMYLYVGSCVNQQFYEDVLDTSHYNSIPEGMTELPELETELSEKLRNFISFLLDTRPFGATFLVVREDSKFRNLFFKRMVDDRSESTMSYYEFLQHLQKQVNS